MFRSYMGPVKRCLDDGSDKGMHEAWFHPHAVEDGMGKPGMEAALLFPEVNPGP